MKTIWKIIGIVLILSLISLAVKLIFFPVRVATKIVTSAGEVVDKTLDADNVIFNYEHFFDMYQSYNRYKDLITTTGKNMENFKKDYGSDISKWTRDTRESFENLRTTLTGYQKMCADIEARYNADSQKLNRNIFKSKNLPYMLGEPGE